jgi:hypothetical protein
MDIRGIGWGGMDCIWLRNLWRTHKMLGNSRVTAQLVASQEGPSSMKLVWFYCYT